MKLFWIIQLAILTCILLGLVIFVFVKPKKFRLFNSLNVALAMNSVIVALILTMGFIMDRPDAFVDIALSYAILGFVTSIILAKYFGGKRK